MLEPSIDSGFTPGYVELQTSGVLRERAEQLWESMKKCKLCPRECGANRLAGEEGFCGSDDRLKIASFHSHFGEEQPLVGRGGSGTIFFSNCSLRCVFCINWDISHGGSRSITSEESLADMMLDLQNRGCHNINIVTPTHYSAHLLKALDLAAAKGLRLPLVYNTHGWERLEILRQMENVVDIYLSDIKYADDAMASCYSSGADSYPELSRAALLEMHRQVGIAQPAPDGLMYRGLMIRHLVMPNGVSGTKEVIGWIGQNLPKDTYLNLMSQYRTMFRAERYPDIARRLTLKEYQQAVKWAHETGLTNVDVQGYRYW
jgi:putative pyruvate formate lyase activating enzyme